MQHQLLIITQCRATIFTITKTASTWRALKANFSVKKICQLSRPNCLVNIRLLMAFHQQLMLLGTLTGPLLWVPTSEPRTQAAINKWIWAMAINLTLQLTMWRTKVKLIMSSRSLAVLLTSCDTTNQRARRKMTLSSPLLGKMRSLSCLLAWDITMAEQQIIMGWGLRTTTLFSNAQWTLQLRYHALQLIVDSSRGQASSWMRRR